MANTHTSLLISALLVLALAVPYATAGYSVTSTKTYATPYKLPDVVIEGLVYCQCCEHSGTWNLDNAEPIGGAEVSVICVNYKERISYYQSFTTSDEGYFYAKLDGFSMRHPYLDHPLQSCTVKLVASPLSTCDVFTNINYGIKGASLGYEDKDFVTDNYEVVVYSAPPLAFRPEHCGPK